MYIPRRLKKGPEYDDSARSARDRNLPKFGLNLETARNLAKFEPEGAISIQDSDIRIAQVYDEANGYSLALYFLGGPLDETSTLLRVEVFQVEDGFEPW